MKSCWACLSPLVSSVNVHFIVNSKNISIHDVTTGEELDWNLQVSLSEAFITMF